MTTTDIPNSLPAAPKSFAALRHPGYRAYFLSMAAAMMADSIEHSVIF